MDVMNYVKPELIVVSFALYFVGVAFKQSQIIADKYIPLFLGGIGIVLCGLWVFATCEIKCYNDILLAGFTSAVQGILVAGLSTYVNQLIKQCSKKE